MLLATFGTIMLCRLWDRFMAQGTKMLLACPAEQVVVVSNLQSYQSKYIRGNAKELVNSSSKKNYLTNGKNSSLASITITNLH